MSSPDVLVIGGGAVGACVALELGRAGASVALVEREAHLGVGCSWGSAGLIAPSHSMPLATPQALVDGVRQSFKRGGSFSLQPRRDLASWLIRFVAACRPVTVKRHARVMGRLCEASFREHERYAAEGLETGFERTGVLYVQESARRAERARLRAQEVRIEGMAATELDTWAATELEPSLVGTFAGAVYYPDDARCDPPAFVQAVGRAAEEAGVDVHTRAAAEPLAIVRNTIVARVDGRTLRPGTVVVAAGAESRTLVRALGIDLLVQPGRGYALELECFDEDPQIPIYLEEARTLATPLPGRLRLSGVLELGGSAPGFSPRRVSTITASLGRVLKGITQARQRLVWCGLRPLSPDGLPIVGRVEQVPSLVLATGHGMMGITLAPITGVLIRKLLAGSSVAELEPLRVERFEGSVRASTGPGCVALRELP
jgi:D-amino-acid dehydrogenase